MTSVHVPVLAGELIDLTAPTRGETAVDCTFGAGGHARLVADRLGTTGTLVCIDRDPAAEARFDELAAEVACETRFLRMDYAEGLEVLVEEGLVADVVYLDLGISSMQVDARERGFSYSYDAPLDMRMDPSQELDARVVLNDWDERQLAQIFRRYGEDPNARRIAREIVRRRRRAPLQTTGELVEAIEAALPAAVRRRFGGGHPAKRVFQAVRIAVNGELDSLDRALPLAWDLLGPGGRLAAISFHSLEDRRVKRFLVERARGCVCPPDFPVCVCGHEPEAELLTGRAVAPTPGEVAAEPARQVGSPASRPPHQPGGGGLMARAAAAAAPAPASTTAGRAAAPARQAPARRQPAPAKRPTRRASGQAAPRRAPAKPTPRRPARKAAPRTAAAGSRCRSAPGCSTRSSPGARWIGLVGVLLAGIVFFNVDLLRMNREITHMADHAAELKRENAGLRKDVAGLANSERIQEAAAAARPRAPGAGRGPLPEVEPDDRRPHRLQAHHRAGPDASRRTRSRPSRRPSPRRRPPRPRRRQPPRRRPPRRRPRPRVSGCAWSSAGSGCCSPSSWCCSARRPRAPPGSGPSRLARWARARSSSRSRTWSCPRGAARSWTATAWSWPSQRTRSPCSPTRS